MHIYSIAEAKAHFSELIAQAETGHWFRLIPNAWDGEDFCQG
jgi:hypothetical protein